MIAILQKAYSIALYWKKSQQVITKSLHFGFFKLKCTYEQLKNQSMMNFTNDYENITNGKGINIQNIFLKDSK